MIGNGPIVDRNLIHDHLAIHFRALVRELDTSTAPLSYHLGDLLGGRRDPIHRGRRRHAYFPEGEFDSLSDEERSMLNAMRQKGRLEIVLALLQGGPAPHKALHELGGGLKGTLSYHLGQLRETGIVEKTDEGHLQLVDAKQTRRLLVRYEPKSTLLDEVHDLCEDLFGGHYGS